MHQMRSGILAFCLLVVCSPTLAFQPVGSSVGAVFTSPTRPPRQVDGSSAPTTSLFLAPKSNDEIDLKAELTEYLRVRKERNADEEAQKEIGRVIGGTKGNKVLDFVSGAPAKAAVREEAPNVFDYEELIKYGFGYLVTPIMDAGGNRKMYPLMDMPPPPISERSKPKSAPKLVIDRTGETDQARYTGLKMGQVLDDDEMARALQNAIEKQKKGESLRPKLSEEDYVQPFADKRNTGPKQVPDWTAERIDEQAKKTGEAIAWAKKAKAGQFKKDPDEILAIEGGLQAYCMASALTVAFAFGRASPSALTLLGFTDDAAHGLLNAAQVPALALLVASFGSAIVSSIVLAPGKNRNGFVWGVKGLAGGPLAIFRLQGLEPLITQAEADKLASNS
jgi:hypothetical protein